MVPAPGARETVGRERAGSGRQARRGPPGEARRRSWTRGAPNSPPRPRTEAARGGGGRGGGEEEDRGAGRSEQLFSLAAPAARGLGRWPPARETVFFLLQASPLPPGGARRCGRAELGAVPTPDGRPAGTARWAGSRGPSPGPRPGHRIPPGGAGGRPRPRSAPSKRETEPGAEEQLCPVPRRRGVPGRLDPSPAPLAHVGSDRPAAPRGYGRTLRGSVRGP